MKVRIKSKSRLTSTEMAMTVMMTMATLPEPLPEVTRGATGGAAGGAAGGAGPTSFNLRVEQNKIPEFFGTKSKDTISAADFIRRL